MRPMKRVLRYALAAGLAAGGIGAASAAPNTQNVVVNATHVVKGLQSPQAQSKGIPPYVLKNAIAVAVIPEVKKGGGFFGGGGHHGVGVLTARKQNGAWSDPVFLNFHAGSVGFHNNAPSSDVVVVFMNTADVKQLVYGQAGNTAGGNGNAGGGFFGGGNANSNAAGPGNGNSGNTGNNSSGGGGGFFGGGNGKGGQITLGSNGVVVAAGPEGGAQRQPAALGNGVYTYSESNGVFSGVALTGARLDVDQNANQQFYGNAVSPGQIIAGNGIQTSQYTKELVSAIKAAEQGGAGNAGNGSSGGAGNAPSAGGSGGSSSGGSNGGGM